MNGKMPIATGSLTRRNLLSAAPLALVAASGLQAIPARAQTVASSGTEAFLDSVGVCGHFTRPTGIYPEQFDRIVPELEALGVRHLRDDGLITVRDSRDSPVFRRLRRIVAGGVRLTIICYDNLNPYVSTPLDRLADFYDWCDAGIDIFEGSNEPNLTKDPQNAPRISAEHQAALHDTIRSVPRLNVVPIAAPSYVLSNRALALDLKNACDYGNIHAYAGMEHPETTGPGALSKSIAASAHIAAGRPVLATEMGYHTSLQTKTFHFPVTEGIKARYMPRMLLWCFISGIRRSYIYEMVSSFAADETNPESSFGLLRHDLSRTPAYGAVRALLPSAAQNGKPDRRNDGSISSLPIPKDYPFTLQDRTVLCSCLSGLEFPAGNGRPASKTRPSNGLRHFRWPASIVRLSHTVSAMTAPLASRQSRRKADNTGFRSATSLRFWKFSEWRRGNAAPQNCVYRVRPLHDSLLEYWTSGPVRAAAI